MNKVFHARARANGAEVLLDLPVSPYEMLDALDRLRLQDPGGVKLRIDEYRRFRFLGPFLTGENPLLELNALAERLSELEGCQETALAGLLEMEIQGKKNPLELPNLINLAYSTKSCQVIGEALNDFQLGRFCAENGIVPDVEKLSARVFEMLDFEQIGRDHRREKGGVLVERNDSHPGGYVERYLELAEVYKTLDLTLREPDYAMLLDVSKKANVSPGCGSGKSVLLKLPATPEALDAALDSLGIYDWQEAVWSCRDCRAPSLTDLVSNRYACGFLNRLAQTLADMSPEELTMYKALLETSDCKNLFSARTLAEQLPSYIFSPQFTSPVSLAEEELAVILGGPEAEMIRKYLDLPSYGKALIEKRSGALTSYGLIERKDGQPVQAPQNARQEGGMTLA